MERLQRSAMLEGRPVKVDVRSQGHLHFVVVAVQVATKRDADTLADLIRGPVIR